MQPSLITELGYVGFAVSDRAAWQKFASDVLGLVSRSGPGGATTLLRMDDRPRRIILADGDSDDIAFTGWRAVDDEAVTTFAARLTAAGVSFEEASDHDLSVRGVDRMIHFADPDGNRHEVFAGIAKTESTFRSPLIGSGFVTGDGGLGHVVFGSNDYSRAVRFAQDILGMHLSDIIRQQFGPVTLDVTFLHINERHHSLAFANRKGAKNLHHFMLEVGSIADVGLTRDRHQEAGLAITQDIGQHPNDKMISYYGETPSGFLIEFGCGGIKIGDGTWSVDVYDRLSDWGHRPATTVRSAA